MKYDIIIENAVLIDPSKQSRENGTLYILKDKIVKAPNKDEKIEYKQKINAQGCIVTKGFIENHTHVYYGGGDTNLNPDVIMLPNLVTSAIDQGSSGWSNFDLFYRSIIANSMMDIKCYLNVSNTGLVTEDYYENINPNYMNEEMIKYYCEKYQDTIIGLKIRLCKDSIKDMKLSPLEKAIEIANKVNLPLSVHVKDLDNITDIANMLRKNDTFVHMYQLKRQTIINSKGQIHKELINAKERGVLFDTASGRNSFSFDIIKKSLNKGFKPDFLGTDLVTYNAFQRPIFSLAYTMSMYLNLGFSIEEILSMVISAPAKSMNMTTQLSTLDPNTKADIAIFKIKEKNITFKDNHGGSLNGDKLIIPQMTIKNGKVVYRNIEF